VSNGRRPAGLANAVDPEMAAMPENVEALRERLGGPLLGRLPRQAQPDAQRLARFARVRLPVELKAILAKGHELAGR